MNEAIVPGSLQLWETDSRESYWQQIVLNGEKKEKKKKRKQIVLNVPHMLQ
mgnify:CR=1 FL=1